MPDVHETRGACAPRLNRSNLHPILTAPVSEEEIARRRALFAKVMALRERIGPIGVRTDELVHMARAEADATDE